MRAQRVWKGIQVDNRAHRDELDRLHAELAAFNARITELEDAHPEKRTIEVLKAGAIVLARRIDEVRCSGATEQLASLLNR
jgi:hypothetical protein